MNLKISVLSLFAIIIFAAFSKKEEPISDEKTFTVVELFTSQGCHSCPPADRLLTKLLEENKDNKIEIIPLSFHVDYWNYLGWKDPYSSNEFSKRQRRYANVLGSGVYTPQIVFNGTTEAIGSREGEVRKQLKKAEKSPEVELKIKVDFDTEGLPTGVNYMANDLPEKAVLNVAVVERGIEDSVKRGENRGKVLKHDNVVRWFKTYDLNGRKNDSGNLYFDLPKEVDVKKSSVVIFVQNVQTLEILAAGQMGLQN